MKEIGGYIQLDEYHLPMMHEDALALNCARNCLDWVIEHKKITKIYLPYFLCNTVAQVCKKSRCEIKNYHINAFFLPDNINLEIDEWIYIVNYYGQLDEKVLDELVNNYGRVIVDNVQAYFDKPLKGINTIYTCRKFFGVADGAFLYTDCKDGYEELPIDTSYERMHFLLGRYEGSANEFYSEYVDNNKLFIEEPIKKMSELTRNLLHGIDYEYVKQRRTDNYNALANNLNKYNRLKPRKIEGAFAYPLWLEDAKEFRKTLIANKIFVPLLWPNVLEEVGEDTLEYDMAANILPLPCDQRYDKEDMYRICEVLNL